MPQSTQPAWYDRVYSEGGALTSARSLEAWQERLKAWLKATAEWNEESAQAVKAYVRHARAQRG